MITNIKKNNEINSIDAFEKVSNTIPKAGNDL